MCLLMDNSTWHMIPLPLHIAEDFFILLNRTVFLPSFIQNQPFEDFWLLHFQDFICLIWISYKACWISNLVTAILNHKGTGQWAWTREAGAISYQTKRVIPGQPGWSKLEGGKDTSTHKQTAVNYGTFLLIFGYMDLITLSVE